jgi:hypothetical protein
VSGIAVEREIPQEIPRHIEIAEEIPTHIDPVIVAPKPKPTVRGVVVARTGGLPFTGGPILSLLAAAAATLIVGTALLAGARRRPAQHR